MSLRTRLLVAVGLVCVLTLSVAGSATYSLLDSYLIGKVDQSLKVVGSGATFAAQHGLRISTCGRPTMPTIGTSPGGATGRGGPDGLPLNSLQTVFVEIRSRDGHIVNGQSCPAYIGTTPSTPALAKAIFVQSLRDQRAIRYMTVAARDGGGPQFRIRVNALNRADVLIVGIPLDDVDNTLHDLLIVELAVSALALLAALGVGTYLIRVGLRPLAGVEEMAESVRMGNLDSRIEGTNDKTEVGRLAGTLNGMLDQIGTAFADRSRVEDELRQQEELLRRFIADASHELRTPIAAIAAYAELVEHWGGQLPSDFERALRGIRIQSSRMGQLIDDLLTLARIDEGATHLSYRENVDLVGTVSEVVSTAHEIHPSWPMSMATSQVMEVSGNPSQLRRVFENLVSNIHAHTPEGTKSSIVLSLGDTTAVVVVTDSGPGMTQSDTAHAFDRFYRSDPARERKSGGNGLGLSIVEGIVRAHGGSTSLESEVGVGTTVTVRIPVAAIRVNVDREQGSA